MSRRAFAGLSIKNSRSRRILAKLSRFGSQENCQISVLAEVESTRVERRLVGGQRMFNKFTMLVHPGIKFCVSPSHIRVNRSQVKSSTFDELDPAVQLCMSREHTVVGGDPTLYLASLFSFT